MNKFDAITRLTIANDVLREIQFTESGMTNEEWDRLRQVRREILALRSAIALPRKKKARPPGVYGGAVYNLEHGVRVSDHVGSEET